MNRIRAVCRTIGHITGPITGHAARRPIAAALLVAAAWASAGCTDRLEPRADRWGADGALIAFGGGEGGARYACATCHGARGEGNGFDAPRLAGLPAGYLQKQLEDHAAGLRPHALMHDVARFLDSDERVRVAMHYASLPPRALPPATTERAAPGTAALYERACAACHGALAEGGPLGPPLAGQPAFYLVQQLQDWQAAKRRNDPEQVMLQAVRGLTPAQVSSLGLHLAALPAPPAPAGR